MTSKYTNSFGISLAAASIANALLVIAKETHPTVMAWMKRMSGHHWATHSLLALAVFFVLGLGLAQANGGQGLKLSATTSSKIAVSGVILSWLIIVGFYGLVD